jgi:hypothetical protein
MQFFFISRIYRKILLVFTAIGIVGFRDAPTSASNYLHKETPSSQLICGITMSGTFDHFQSTSYDSKLTGVFPVWSWASFADDDIGRLLSSNQLYSPSSDSNTGRPDVKEVSSRKDQIIVQFAAWY